MLDLAYRERESHDISALLNELSKLQKAYELAWDICEGWGFRGYSEDHPWTFIPELERRQRVLLEGGPIDWRWVESEETKSG